MKGAGVPLIGLGVVVILVGLLNHFVIKANPIGHFSIILGVVGVIIAAIGAVAMGSKAS